MNGLTQTKSLKKLHLAGNKIKNTDSIGEMLKINNTLQYLNLSSKIVKMMFLFFREFNRKY